MNRHAYLIMAHNNFATLQNLIHALDDSRNDIYVHIDAKSPAIPVLVSAHSYLKIIDKRIDVQWAHISQVKAEYALLEEAVARCSYAYYHIISGTHFPLRSQKEIHGYYDSLCGRSVVMSLFYTDVDLMHKLGKRHFYLANAVNGSGMWHLANNLLWRLMLRFQKESKARKERLFKGKFSQWVSLSANDIKSVMDMCDEVLDKFRYAFCSDEHFIPYIFAKSGIKPVDNPKLLYMDFPGASPRNLTVADYDALMHSNAIFARKFSDEDVEITRLIRNSYSK